MITRRAVAFFTFLLAAGGVLPASQDQANPALSGIDQQKLEQARARLDEIKQRLNLTPEQQEQVKPIIMDELQQLRAVRDKYGDANASRRTKLKMAREMRGVQESTDEKLKKVLSKQQMDELKKIREEWRQQFRERANQKRG